MGDNEGDKREEEEEEEFAQLLLKAVQDLSRNIEGMGQRNGNGNNGKGVQGDLHFGEGSCTSHHHASLHANMPLIHNRPPRSTIPTFLQSGAGGQSEQEEAPYGNYFVEYQSYGSEFGRAITFKGFCQLKGNNKSKGQNGGGYVQGTNLQRIVARLFFPTFDGSKSSAKAWVEKLGVYFQLNQMTEGEAIKIATLHLEGEAHNLWFHGLTMLGHVGVTAYDDFTRRVLEQFERKDLKENFGVLTRFK